jgi:hypothetical protein
MGPDNGESMPPSWRNGGRRACTFSASAGYPPRSTRRSSIRNLDSCGKLAAVLDNAIEKYYLRFHDRGDAD